MRTPRWCLRHEGYPSPPLRWQMTSVSSGSDLAPFVATGRADYRSVVAASLARRPTHRGPHMPVGINNTPPDIGEIILERSREHRGTSAPPARMSRSHLSKGSRHVSCSQLFALNSRGECSDLCGRDCW